MHSVLKMKIVLILAVLFIAGCSSSPEVQQDPYNSADSQRSRASQAQDELDSNTSGNQ
jgi:uncharacterized lipoprotein